MRGRPPTFSPDDNQRLGRLLWIAIQRFGPIDMERLADLVPANFDAGCGAVKDLISEGRVASRTDANGTELYSSDECFIPPEDPADWEAAMFDHFQAVVATLAARLRMAERDPEDRIGGGTFSFEVWRGHPLFHEAVSLLSQTRSRARALREKIRDFNAGQPNPQEHSMRVVFYAGQSVIGLDEEERNE